MLAGFLAASVGAALVQLLDPTQCLATNAASIDYTHVSTEGGHTFATQLPLLALKKKARTFGFSPCRRRKPSTSWMKA